MALLHHKVVQAGQSSLHQLDSPRLLRRANKGARAGKSGKHVRSLTGSSLLYYSSAYRAPVEAASPSPPFQKRGRQKKQPSGNWLHKTTAKERQTLARVAVSLKASELSGAGGSAAGYEIVLPPSLTGIEAEKDATTYVCTTAGSLLLKGDYTGFIDSSRGCNSVHRDLTACMIHITASGKHGYVDLGKMPPLPDFECAETIMGTYRKCKRGSRHCSKETKQSSDRCGPVRVCISTHFSRAQVGSIYRHGTLLPAAKPECSPRSQ